MSLTTDLIKKAIKSKDGNMISDVLNIQFPEYGNNNVTITEYDGSVPRLYSNSNDDFVIMLPNKMNVITENAVVDAIESGAIFDDRDEINNKVKYITMTHVPVVGMSHHNMDEPKELPKLVGAIVGALGPDGHFGGSDTDIENGKNYINDLTKHGTDDDTSIGRLTADHLDVHNDGDVSDDIRHKFEPTHHELLDIKKIKPEDTVDKSDYDEIGIDEELDKDDDNDTECDDCDDAECDDCDDKDTEDNNKDNDNKDDDEDDGEDNDDVKTEAGESSAADTIEPPNQPTDSHGSKSSSVVEAASTTTTPTTTSVSTNTQTSTPTPQPSTTPAPTTTPTVSNTAPAVNTNTSTSKIDTTAATNTTNTNTTPTTIKVQTPNVTNNNKSLFDKNGPGSVKSALKEARDLQKPVMKSSYKTEYKTPKYEYDEYEMYKESHAILVKPKRLKPIPRDVIAYITTQKNSIRDTNDQAMISGYTCSKLELVDFYLNCIDTKDYRYIVPHNRQYLIQMQNDLNRLLQEILRVKPVNRLDRVWRINVTYPEGYGG